MGCNIRPNDGEVRTICLWALKVISSMINVTRWPSYCKSINLLVCLQCVWLSEPIISDCIFVILTSLMSFLFCFLVLLHILIFFMLFAAYSCQDVTIFPSEVNFVSLLNLVPFLLLLTLMNGKSALNMQSTIVLSLIGVVTEKGGHDGPKSLT